MHRLVHWLAAPNRFARICYRLTVSILIAVCIASGCTKKPIEKKLVLNLTKSREISGLSGGKWIGQFYHIQGDRNLHLSIVLDEDRRFDFDSVNHVYADRLGSKITAVRIAGFGYSKEKVIERLREMHQQWNGRHLGDIEKWITDTEKNGGLRGHSSLIHKSEGANDPSIGACIYYNFGGKNDAWYIMFSVTWPLQPPEPSTEVIPDAEK